jgi:hypothetical protein
MTAAARIQIEPRTESVGHCLDLRELRHAVIVKKVEFPCRQSSDRLTRTRWSSSDSRVRLRA